MASSLYLVHDSELGFDINASSSHLARLFSQECGFRPLPWMARKMTSWLLKGFDPALIEEAIRRTSMAPRPSWAYLEAILRNAEKSKTFDLDEFFKAETEYIASRNKTDNKPMESYKHLDRYHGIDWPDGR